MYTDVSFKDKLSTLSSHYPSSAKLAEDLGVSRMSLVNWRDNPDQINPKNRDQIDYIYCREIILPTMPDELATNSPCLLDDAFYTEPHIKRAMVTRLSFGSLEIETGTTERAFKSIVQDDVVAPSMQAKNVLEISNIYQTTSRVIERFRQNPINIDGRMVCEWHSSLMSGVRDDAGFYSTKIRIVPDTDLQLTAADDIEEEIEHWCIKYKSLVDMIGIAKAHAHFELIHPFGDGNGRVGRIIMMWHCMQAEIMPPLISQSNKALYYATLEYAQRTGQHGGLATFLNNQSVQMCQLINRARGIE